MRIKISFVIPAHNEEQYIAGTLKAISDAMQHLDASYDVTVVNDASTDKTRIVASQFGVHIVDANLRNIAAARNFGASRSTGDIIIWTDADTLVNKSLVQGVLDAVKYGAVGGGCRLVFDRPAPFWGRLMAGICVVIFSWIKLAAGSFVFCTRSAFDESGGFNEKLFASEEIDFSWRLKKLGKFVILPDAVITSARKIRSYSFWEIMIMSGKILLMPGILKHRDKLDIWYERRN
tara:strand:- start:97 stop:798 length:702 start_codon:yes stop_codon:yes gene_type:complete